MFWGVHLFLCSVLASESLLSFVCLRVHVTYSFLFFFCHRDRPPSKRQSKKSSREECQGRAQGEGKPTAGIRGGRGVDEEVEKEEEERKTHSMFLCFRLSGAVVSTLRVLRKAIKRPRTRSATARPVSNAHKRDLVTNQNI